MRLQCTIQEPVQRSYSRRTLHRPIKMLSDSQTARQTDNLDKCFIQIVQSSLLRFVKKTIFCPVSQFFM